MIAKLDNFLARFGYYAWRNPNCLFGIQFGKIAP